MNHGNYGRAKSSGAHTFVMLKPHQIGHILAWFIFRGFWVTNGVTNPAIPLK